MRHARPPRRRRKVLLVAAGIVGVVALAVAGVAGYGWWRLSQIQRDSLALAESSGGVQNFLIVGSDSRDSVSKSDEDAAAFLNEPGASTAGRRSDTIMVARVDSRNRTVDLMSLPRDLYVPIAPSGDPDRINSAFSRGTDNADGAQRLIDTIRSALGVDINHYVEINFKSFKGITEAVDGMPLYFDRQVRDRSSGLYVMQTGCFTLDGEAADRATADGLRDALVKDKGYALSSAGADARGGRRLPYPFAYTLRTGDLAPRQAGEGDTKSGGAKSSEAAP